MEKDKYDKLEHCDINPNILYDEINKEMYCIEKHLEILQAIINNGMAAREIIRITDSLYGIHRDLDTISNYCPMKNNLALSKEE